MLAKAVNRWEGIAVYSPIINGVYLWCVFVCLFVYLPCHGAGVGGNLVAVQASRISTSLHQVSSPGQPVPSPSHRYHGPHRSFFYGSKL